MKKINAKDILFQTSFYQELKLFNYIIKPVYQKNRILLYVYNSINNSFISTYILNFKYNLTNTKCQIIITKDGILKDIEIVDLVMDKGKYLIKKRFV